MRAAKRPRMGRIVRALCEDDMRQEQRSQQQSPRRTPARACRAQRAQPARGSRTRFAGQSRHISLAALRPLPGAWAACSAEKNCSRCYPAARDVHVDRIGCTVCDKPCRFFRVALENPNSLTLEDAVLRSSALRSSQGFRVDGNNLCRSVVDEVHSEVLCLSRSDRAIRPRFERYRVTSDVSTTFDCASQQIVAHLDMRPNV